ncbi:MAG: CcoQ/FixQ family Cbb3-type cytochrome c oxidase assembly chaperone [Kordiimonas sp.]|nr:CcoQ/FixQ family Cbb3-type cytochrome c oxidase assembly chaperone [Kordiimonas sp.]|tara:strand:+ start:692 stop:847 length:156 start_codon:yes stop_codon:yes gene_type:complete
MELTHADVAAFAQSWGLVYLFILFIGTVVYALWPSNKKKFNDAANLPLSED